MKIEGNINNIQLEKVDTPKQQDVASIAKQVQTTPTVLVDTVSIEVKPKNDTIQKNQARNKEISILNLAGDKAEKMDNILSSVKGIVEQVANNDLSPKKVKILQKEANELLSQMKSLDVNADAASMASISNDDVKYYIEEKMGDTLDAILPDVTEDTSAIGGLDFSRKESIINTLATVKFAEAKIIQLKEAVRQNVEELEKLTKEEDTPKDFEVDFDNNIENIVKLTNTISEKIECETQEAIFANVPKQNVAIELIK